MPSPPGDARVGILINVDSFEDYFPRVFGLDRAAYAAGYRNDWAWAYMAALRGSPFEPVLYVPTFGEAADYRTPDGYTVRMLHVARAAKMYWKLPLIPRSRFGSYTRELLNALSLAPALWRALRRDSVRVLYVQEIWTARFDFLALLSPVPVIGGDHGSPPAFARAAVKRWAMRRARAVTVLSYSSQRLVRDAVGVTSAYLPNGVDTAFFRPAQPRAADPGPVGRPGPGRGGSPRSRARMAVSPPPGAAAAASATAGTRRLLTVGRLTDTEKRTSDLIRAMALLGRDWQLEIVGSGPDRPSLEALARSVGVADRVVFLGFVQDRELLRERYRRCDVFAMSSATEAKSLAVLEAMACGCAVVATEIDAFREVIEPGETGFLVPVGSPEALAGAVDRAYAARESLGPRARAAVAREWSYDRMRRDLRELVAHCAAEGRRPGVQAR